MHRPPEPRPAAAGTGPSPTTINILFGMPLVEGGPAYTCTRLGAAMADETVRTRLYAPLDRRLADRRGLPATTGLPQGLNPLPFTATRHLACPMIEARFAADCRNDRGSIAYLWGETSLALARRLQNQGTLTVREKINSGKAMASLILRDAYASLDALSAFDDTTYGPGRLAKEREELERADFVYCPSPQVFETLQAIGLPAAKLIPTSYGYEPDRIAGDTKALAPADGPTFLFVGLLCVRKGAHLLLDAWVRSGVRGRLVLLGRIEPLIAERYAATLARPDVEHHAFSPDVGAYYRSADYFIFPSLEEGGPQVTYEAAACGVPSIVTPAGAGAIIRDGLDGEVIDSADPEVWAERLITLDPGSERYRRQSAAAAERALSFTWARVAGQRRRDLLDRAAAAGWPG